MKITKLQLKQIIKEELESVTEMFGRDLDVPKYDDDLKMGGEKEYDRIIQTIKELLEVSTDGELDLAGELQAIADYAGKNSSLVYS